MFYAITSFLALVLNLIINWDSLKNLRGRPGEAASEQKVTFRYNLFLIASNFYFFADICWGLLYENRHIDALFPFLYVDCLFYFFFMFLTMLTWIRYIVAYLDKHDLKSKTLLNAVWIMFALAVIYLIINCFHPFIYYFTETHEYIVEPGRHITFILQIILYIVTSSYLLFIAHKSTGGKKFRYAAVGLTSLVMEVFLIFQIFDDAYPSYALGLIIGICVVHSFADNYEAMYYINIETGAFMEFSKSEEYAAMQVPVGGRDFYEETRLNIDRFVHPDDREFAKKLHQKETMLKNLENRKSYSYKYRLLINGQQKYFQFTLMRAPDGKHFIISEKDINDEMTADRLLKSWLLIMTLFIMLM